ncbi:MAG: DUF2279 domain-containing protein [Cytophagales bacterium]|nr:DUF2279 domain-containing protein [Cytophagales bacterium]
MYRLNTVKKIRSTRKTYLIIGPQMRVRTREFFLILLIGTSCWTPYLNLSASSFGSLNQGIGMHASALGMDYTYPLSVGTETMFSAPSPFVVAADSLNRTRLIGLLSLAGGLYGGMWATFGYAWYKGQEFTFYTFENDFGGYLQMDKLGHMLYTWSYTHVGYHGLRFAGASKKSSLLYSGLSAFALVSAIEITDGLVEKWGFSWPDLIANGLGSALFLGQTWYLDERPLKLKFSLWPSHEATVSGGLFGTSPMDRIISDYNGKTFWASLQANKIISSDFLAPWIDISVGYSIDNVYGEYENHEYFNGLRLPDAPRTRRYLLSLDVDWAQIPVENSFLRGLFQAMFFVKLPFPALEINSEGNFRGYWLYF